LYCCLNIVGEVLAVALGGGSVGMSGVVGVVCGEIWMVFLLGGGDGGEVHLGNAGYATTL
jgi:hypothetical protein